MINILKRRFKGFISNIIQRHTRQATSNVKREIILAKNEIDLWNNRNKGISEGNKNKIVVSLTTIPERLYEVALAINTLLKQTVKPDKVILWLDEENIRMKELPNCYENLIERGLTVERCKDVGPHTKLIHALKKFPDSIIVTADDDVLYPPNWLQLLLDEYEVDENKIYCHKGHLMTFTNGEIDRYDDWDLDTDFKRPSLKIFPTGVGGVLYPPGTLDKVVFREEIFQEVCPKADDIWFKATSLLNNVECKILDNRSQFRKDMFSIEYTQLYGLHHENVFGNENDEQLYQTFKKLDLLKKDFS